MFSAVKGYLGNKEFKCDREIPTVESQRSTSGSSTSLICYRQQNPQQKKENLSLD